MVEATNTQFARLLSFSLARTASRKDKCPMEDTSLYPQYDAQGELPGQMIPTNDNQIRNAAGGYVYSLDIWGRLDRFLILGNDGPTYYVSAKDNAKAGVDTVCEALNENGARAVMRIRDISVAGRAPKNDPAIKALALASIHGDQTTRQLALMVLPQVCRTGTHLFQFAELVNQGRGWGRALKRAVAEWYTDKTADNAAFQMAKYRQRGGWSHSDLLRLSHPVPPSAAHRALFRWAVGKPAAGDLPLWAGLVDLLAATEDKAEVIRIVTDYAVPWELVPTQWLGDKDVWAALLPNMPLGALVRNLGRLGANGLLSPLSGATKTVTDKLRNGDAILKARLHPIAILSALRVYEQGHGERGNLAWRPVQQVVDAVNEAFYLAFGAVQPSGETYLLGVDVSGSMTGGTIAGVPGLTPNWCAAAMSLVTANVESNYHVMGFSNQFVDLGISPKMRLSEVARLTQRSFGNTDCAVPVTWALRNKVKVDKFIIYTDGETWAGPVHVDAALRRYRDEMGVDAKMIQVAMTATKGSLNCPSDPRALDVVGFDTATPSLISSF
jgi:60 kDa SS-A/Ro ribonucleoprotein